MRLTKNGRFHGSSPLQHQCITSHLCIPVRIIHALAVLAALLISAWPVAAYAQVFQGGLMEAVLLTLQHEPNVAAASRQISLSQGQLQSAQGEFDTVLDAGIATGQSRGPLIAALQAPGRNQINARTTSYSAGSTTRLRSGMTVAPVLRVEHLRDNFNAVSRPASSQLALNITLPLLRGRGVEANTAAERAAREVLHATELVYRHTVAGRIANTANAYWDLLAALRSLDIRVKSEARAQLLLDDARRLAKG
ncbi:MAG: hypothetical protein EOO80_08820, partial [Oxalobacteraceae bacterium]